MYNWLYRCANVQEKPNSAQPSPIGPVRIKGHELSCNPEQVLQVGREALQLGRGDHSRYYSWYVMVDGQRVSSKWLISQLTGLPIAQFSTTEAIHVLKKLGIEASRIEN
jgi:hypothetical protein